MSRLPERSLSLSFDPALINARGPPYWGGLHFPGLELTHTLKKPMFISSATLSMSQGWGVEDVGSLGSSGGADKDGNVEEMSLFNYSNVIVSLAHNGL